MQNGMNRQTAEGVATRKLQQSGNLNQNGQPTYQGVQRGNMTPEERAIDRAVKEHGGNRWDYVYNYQTNRATKRK